MLTTTTQTFVAEPSKTSTARPSSSSFTWSDSIRPATPRHPADSPTDAAAEMSSPDAAPSSPQSSPSLDVSSRFGVRLRELRRERNLTQLRMARDFGIDRSFISDVERGRKSISLPMLEVIALGMKISLSELLRNL
ncbi:helix-turn-helix domain-containing protein [Granulicella aggregans]|uniref:helix-turn-helix domain-containing protein n=1 Tax=Granulicella aggregans TaxID=474949 RepID=UPI0021DFA81B|nr:helix-turn-helix transcriptional regulator [Granulicella aggregans]